MGNHIYGCDVCQESLPLEHQVRAFCNAQTCCRHGTTCRSPLLDLIALDDAGFRERFRGSPIKRTKRRGLLRNVAVALGNWGDLQAVPALARALDDHDRLFVVMRPGHSGGSAGRRSACARPSLY